MKVMLRTRTLRPQVLNLGPISIKGLVVEDESWGETRLREKKDRIKLIHSLHNVASNRTHRAVKSAGVFVETEAVGIGAAALDGDGSYSGARILLYPKPSRLLRVGVAWAGKRVEKLEDLDWYEVPAHVEFYVYEGGIEAEKPWDLIVLDLEDDQRIVLPSELKPARLRAEKAGGGPMPGKEGEAGQEYQQEGQEEEEGEDT